MKYIKIAIVFLILSMGTLFAGPKKVSEDVTAPIKAILGEQSTQRSTTTNFSSQWTTITNNASYDNWEAMDGTNTSADSIQAEVDAVTSWATWRTYEKARRLEEKKYNQIERRITRFLYRYTRFLVDKVSSLTEEDPN